MELKYLIANASPISIDSGFLIIYIACAKNPTKMVEAYPKCAFVPWESGDHSLPHLSGPLINCTSWKQSWVDKTPLVTPVSKLPIGGSVALVLPFPFQIFFLVFKLSSLLSSDPPRSARMSRGATSPPSRGFRQGPLAESEAWTRGRTRGGPGTGPDRRGAKK